MTTLSEPPALSRYRTDAVRLGRRFQALASEDVLHAVWDYLPRSPAQVLDIGAGSGRDAAWFVQQGHKVTAVEPVAEMAEQAASLSGSGLVEWLQDQLPTLEMLEGRDGTIEFCLLSGVWHHLSDIERRGSIKRIAQLLSAGGRLAISLRIGGEADGKTVFPIDPNGTIALAQASGLKLIHRAETQSVQAANIAAGVTWVWLVFERTAEDRA